MKVYYVNSLYDGCAYVRTLMPLIYNGWDGDKVSMRGKRADPTRSFQGAMDADVVVFHRPDDPRKIEAMKLLKLAGKKVVFDNDDTYKSVDAMKFRESLEKRIAWIDQAVKEADLVTTTTEYLAEEYRKINPNVVVLPNQVDPDDWEERLENETGKVRIGIVGSAVSNEDPRKIAKFLKELASRDDVTLVLFGLPPDHKDYSLSRKIYSPEIEFWKEINPHEWQPLVPQADYMDTLRELKLDIMLIPREDSYFNRCKSNVKFLEASMLEIACVVQGFEDGKSPYQQNGDDKYMSICFSEDDFRKETEKLIKDEKLRKETGRRAKEYVLNNYNIHKNYILWEQAYKTLWK